MRAAWLGILTVVLCIAVWLLERDPLDPTRQSQPRVALPDERRFVILSLADCLSPNEASGCISAAQGQRTHGWLPQIPSLHGNVDRSLVVSSAAALARLNELLAILRQVESRELEEPVQLGESLQERRERQEVEARLGRRVNIPGAAIPLARIPDILRGQLGIRVEVRDPDGLLGELPLFQGMIGWDLLGRFPHAAIVGQTLILDSAAAQAIRVYPLAALEQGPLSVEGEPGVPEYDRSNPRGWFYAGSEHAHVDWQTLHDLGCMLVAQATLAQHRALDQSHAAICALSRSDELPAPSPWQASLERKFDFRADQEPLEDALQRLAVLAGVPIRYDPRASTSEFGGVGPRFGTCNARQRPLHVILDELLTDWELDYTVDAQGITVAPQRNSGAWRFYSLRHLWPLPSAEVRRTESFSLFLRVVPQDNAEDLTLAPGGMLAFVAERRHRQIEQIVGGRCAARLHAIRQGLVAERGREKRAALATEDAVLLAYLFHTLDVWELDQNWRTLWAAFARGVLLHPLTYRQQGRLWQARNRWGIPASELAAAIKQMAAVSPEPDWTTETLRAALHGNNPREVRWAAWEALCEHFPRGVAMEWGFDGARLQPFDPDLHATLVARAAERLASGDRKSAERAAWMLGEISFDSSAARGLAASIVLDPAFEEILRNVDERVAAEALNERLHDIDPEIRRAACARAGEYNVGGSLEQSLRSLLDDPLTAAAARRALEQINGTSESTSPP